MRKLAIIMSFVLSLSLAGCGKQEAREHQHYQANGRYYLEGIVVTEDGNVWEYETDTISNKPAFNHQAVWVTFDDNGTPETIEDDVILGLVWDLETTIYDQLEKERNNTKIGGKL